MDKNARVPTMTVVRQRRWTKSVTKSLYPHQPAGPTAKFLLGARPASRSPYSRRASGAGGRRVPHIGAFAPSIPLNRQGALLPAVASPRMPAQQVGSNPIHKFAYFRCILPGRPPLMDVNADPRYVLDICSRSIAADCRRHEDPCTD